MIEFMHKTSKTIHQWKIGIPMEQINWRPHVAASLLLLYAALFLCETEAYAQNAPPSYIEEIVTIGTRVKGRTETQTPVPVDVINLGAISDNGFIELGPMLQALAPSFNFSRTQISDGSDLLQTGYFAWPWPRSSACFGERQAAASKIRAKSQWNRRRRGCWNGF